MAMPMPITPIPDQIKVETEDKKEEIQIDDKDREEIDLTPVLPEAPIDDREEGEIDLTPAHREIQIEDSEEKGIDLILALQETQTVRKRVLINLLGLNTKKLKMKSKLLALVLQSKKFN